MTEETFVRELERRADDVHGVPLSLETVRGRARQIRRRRRTAAAVGVAAAVAAIATPVALMSGNDGSRSPEPAPSPTRAVDPDQNGLPTLQSGVIIYQDGPRIPLQGDLRTTAQSFAVLGTDRFVVVSAGADGDREGALVDDAGAVVARFPLYSGITTGPGGSSVAWVEPDRSLHLLIAGSDDDRTIPVAGVRPTETTAIQGDCAQSCTIAVRSAAGGDLGSTVLISPDGTVTDGPAAVPAIADISADGSLVAGSDGIADDDIHVCGGVYDVTAGNYAWRGCEDNVYDFSPDGALVATTFSEGLGPTSIAIRDARSGDELQRIGDPGDWIPSFAWEDSTHLLAVVVAEGGATSLQRLGLDGTRTTVLDGFTTSTEDLEPTIMLPS